MTGVDTRMQNLNTRDISVKGLLFLACLVVTTWFSVYAIYNFDIFWHLANGRAMLEQGRVINEEIFSFTANGTSFHNHSWLAQIFLYLVYSIAEDWGLHLFRMMAVASVFTLLVLVSVQRGGSWFWSCVISALFCAAGAHRFMVRPELFSLLGIVLFLLLLAHADKAVRSKVARILVPLALLVWNCLHGAVFGLFILGLYAVGATLMAYIPGLGKFFPEESVSGKKEVLGVWLWLFLGGLFITLSPYGLSYADLFSLMTENVNIARTSEFMPTSLSPVFWPFWGGLGLSSAVVVMSLVRRRILFTDFVLVVCLAVLAIRYNRATAAFLLVAAPIVAIHVSGLLKDCKKSRLVGGASVVLAGGALIAMLLMSLNVKLNYPPMKFGWGINTSAASAYPIGISRFLNENHISGNLYNSDRFGGYLSYHLPRESKIFFYNLPAVFNDMYQQVHNKSWLDKWNLNYAIVGHAIETKYLFTPQDWTPIFWEPNAILLIRKDARNAEIVNSFKLRLFNPGLTEGQFRQYASRADTAPVLLRETATYLRYREDDRLAGLFAGVVGTAGTIPMEVRMQMTDDALTSNGENPALRQVRNKMSSH